MIQKQIRKHITNVIKGGVCRRSGCGKMCDNQRTRLKVRMRNTKETMKRTVIFLFAVVFGGMLAAQTRFTVGDLTYEVLSEEDNSVEVRNCIYYAISVNIPPTVTNDGTTYSVKAIGDSAFYNHFSLATVTIPEGVTNIGYKAFSGCSALTSVTIPESVTAIEGFAFYYCSSLTCITIPDGVITIGYKAFGNCSSLTSVTVGDNVRTIGDNAFEGCVGLTSVTIPDGVTAIGEFAFSDCRSLSSVTIGKGVMTVERFAFFYCSGLTSVVLPEGVTDIGERAFSGCFGLTSVVSFAHVPPELGNDCFTGVNTKDCSLIVPCDDKTVYQTSDWSEWFETDNMTGSYYAEISATINDGETYTEYGFSESQSGTYTRTVANTGECDSTIVLHLSVNVSLSAVGTNESDIMLYPNPAKDFVRLERGEATERMQVVLFDINGRMVREYVFPQGQRNLEINLCGLPAGLYSVKAGNTSRKLIVE